MSLAGMIREAEKSLGLGEPNHIQRWYAKRNGSAYSYNFAWCDAAITYWSVKAGEHDAVCFGTDYAYTVAHASRFKSAGRWRSGTSGIRRGDIVFFDWGGSRGIAYIDHVGIVTGVSGSRIYTIEGNTSNRCLRRTRSAGVIAGYGRPAYGSGGSAGGAEDDVIGLELGDTGEPVKALQVLITYAGQPLPRHGVDGDYGEETAEALRQVRASVGSEAKSGYGDRVTGWAYAQLMRAVARAN